MIKIKRMTKTVVIFEDTGQISERETDLDLMIVAPRWVSKLARKIAHVKLLAERELEAWRSDMSLMNKICYGYQMV